MEINLELDKKLINNEDIPYISNDSENDDSENDNSEIDESILKLVYEKNLERNFSSVDLELNNNIDNIKKYKKKHKTKIKHNISLQELHKNSNNIEKINIIRKFNPRLPPYFLVKKIEKIF